MVLCSHAELRKELPNTKTGHTIPCSEGRFIENSIQPVIPMRLTFRPAPAEDVRIADDSPSSSPLGLDGAKGLFRSGLSACGWIPNTTGRDMSSSQQEGHRLKLASNSRPSWWKKKRSAWGLCPISKSPQSHISPAGGRVLPKTVRNGQLPSRCMEAPQVKPRSRQHTYWDCTVVLWECSQGSVHTQERCIKIYLEVALQIWHKFEKVQVDHSLHQCQVNTLPIAVLPIEFDCLLGKDTLATGELDTLWHTTLWGVSHT